MTTSTGMSNFKRMAQRFAKEGKLLTALEKSSRRENPLAEAVTENHLSLYCLQSHLLRLVLKPCKKAVF